MNIEKLKEIIVKYNPEQEWIVNNLLFLGYSGSKLYGTSTKDSDTDIRGVCFAAKDFWIGAKTFEQFEYIKDDIDMVIWDIRKFIKQIARTSPNTTESLFVPVESTIHKTNYWDIILPRIKSLLNKSAYDAYHGYSLSQLKKLENKWFNKTGRQYIVNTFGFDVKFAAHGFRLITQGKELLTTGNITFPRPDFQELLDIRYGKKYSKDQIEQCLDDWNIQLDSLKIAKQNSVLPDKADFEVFNKLLVEIYENVVDL